MRSILVVANQTLGGEALTRRMRDATGAQPCRFHLAVPATPPSHMLAWSEGEAHVIAQRRLDDALRRLGREGLTVTGEVADPSPLMAIADALRHDRYDEVILSTLPVGVSRWLHLDLPSRIRRRFGVPVSHVVADAEPLPA
jgi:hypothetical protein